MSEYDGIFSIPKDIIFPDELNRYLKEQILAFNHENGMLQKQLQETEEKCVQMQKELESLKEQTKREETPIIPQFLDPSKTINTKIVELSKNFREKCAELETYKTKYSKLLSHLEEIKKNECDEKQSSIKSVENNKSENDTLTEIKQLQDKLNMTTNKMLEFKNANLQLRNELKQANRLLQQETGEDLNSLQGNPSWKGRAQIICDLQDKNKKLQEKLRNIKEFGGQFDLQNQNEKISGKLANLEKENSDLKSTNETYKNKVETLRSRCNMLEAGQQELKLKIANGQQRSAKELEIIANMSNQLAEAENKKRQALREKENEISKLKMENRNVKDQMEDYRNLVNSLKGKLNESKNDNDGVETKQSSENDFKQHQLFQKVVSNLEEEKVKLLELIELQKKRLEQERIEHEKCKQLYRLEKQRTIRLEATVAKSDLESAPTHRSSYSLIAQSSRTTESSLRDRLELAEENIKALHTRLQLEQREKKEDYQEFAKILKVSSKINT